MKGKLRFYCNSLKPGNREWLCWDIITAVLRVKLIAIQIYLNKPDECQIKNLPSKRIRYRRTKSEISKRKDIIKIRDKINKIEN